jgi:hypothetical protein
VSEHINSYARDSKDGLSAFEVFKQILDEAEYEAFMSKLGFKEIPSKDIILNSSLLSK